MKKIFALVMVTVCMTVMIDKPSALVSDNNIKNNSTLSYKLAKEADDNEYKTTELTQKSTTCDTIFKNDNGTYNRTYYLVQNAFKIIKYAAVISVLVFSILDFVKAVASGDKDLLSKASTKSLKRLIIGAAIFFLPIILNFLFGIIGEFTTCNLV